VSIVRIGLAETKHFSEGWEAIFGGKRKKTESKKAESAAKPARGKKKKSKKK
jgi:hypothetical protein